MKWRYTFVDGHLVKEVIRPFMSFTTGPAQIFIKSKDGEETIFLGTCDSLDTREFEELPHE